MQNYYIIDLDGTLIRGNSFTLFVKFAMRHFPAAAPGTAFTALLRKLRLISHSEAKRRIMKRTSRYFHGKPLEKFLSILELRVRPYFREILASHPGIMILASAAPEEYALPLAERLGFDAAVATTAGCREECRGERKVSQLKRIGVIFDRNTHVFTDHTDDLPLLRANAEGKNHLVAPCGELPPEARRHGLNFEIIPE